MLYEFVIIYCLQMSYCGCRLYISLVARRELLILVVAFALLLQNFGKW